jgi:hypothetical protein
VGDLYKARGSCKMALKVLEILTIMRTIIKKEFDAKLLTLFICMMGTES